MKLLCLNFAWIVMICTLHFGCASNTLTFSSDKKATVSIVTFNDPNGEGQIIGESPQSLDFDKIEKKVVKIWGDGLIPQYWVFAPFPGANTEIKLTMAELPKSNAKQDSKSEKPKDTGSQPEDSGPNSGNDKETNNALTTLKLSSRMVMRAYAALAAKDYSGARELAKKVTDIAPNIAAPHLIIGMTHLSEGQRQAARKAFEVAVSLDPEDPDAKELLDAAR